MNIDSLTTFVLVAELLNFSEAARQLSLPRATVSARIQELEKKLGVRLLLRNNRKVSLTPEGELYLQKCRQAIALLNDAQQQISGEHEVSGLIRIGLPATVPNKAFLHWLMDFSEQYPKTQIQLMMSDDPADLVEQRIDLAIRGRQPVQNDLIARPLKSESMKLVATQAWLSQQDFSKGLDQLCVYDPLDMLDCDHQMPSIMTKDLSVVLSLCKADRGAAYLPEAFIESALVTQQIIEVVHPTLKNKKALELFLVYQHRDLLSHRVRLLIDFLLEHFNR